MKTIIKRTSTNRNVIGHAGDGFWLTDKALFAEKDGKVYSKVGFPKRVMGLYIYRKDNKTKYVATSLVKIYGKKKWEKIIPSEKIVIIDTSHLTKNYFKLTSYPNNLYSMSDKGLIIHIEKGGLILEVSHCPDHSVSPKVILKQERSVLHQDSVELREYFGGRLEVKGCFQKEYVFTTISSHSHVMFSQYRNIIAMTELLTAESLFDADDGGAQWEELLVAEKTICIVDLDIGKQFKINVSNPLTAIYIVSESVILASSESGILEAWNFRDGSRLWATQFDYEIDGVWSHHGRIYLSFKEGSTLLGLLEPNFLFE